MTDLLPNNAKDLEKSMLDRVDTIIDRAIENDNPHDATQQMQLLIDAQQLVGKTLAKFLFKLQNSWESFSLSSQETFNEFLSSSITISINTRNTYPNYWRHKSKLPEEFDKRPLREIIPVTNAISQGFKISNEVWDKLGKATNPSEVSRIVREDIKKRPPKKGTQQGYVYDDGSVVSWKNGRREEVGFLDVNSENPDVVSLINRIIDGAGLIRK